MFCFVSVLDSVSVFSLLNFSVFVFSFSFFVDYFLCFSCVLFVGRSKCVIFCWLNLFAPFLQCTCT